jgi:Flp pilus assembly pilin Flp
MSILDRLLRSTEGQDMVEYVLILAFVSLAGAAALMGVGADVTAIWSIVNTRLSAANN